MHDDVFLDALLGRMARNELPWGQALGTDFNAFEDRFTLHDSVCIGIFMALHGYNEAVLVIEWDGHWLPEPLRTECMPGETEFPEWPFLFVRLSQVLAVRHDGYEDPCDGRTISHIEWRDEGDIKTLEIRDVIDGAVSITYGGDTEFLALDRRDGRVLDLKKVEPRGRLSP